MVCDLWGWDHVWAANSLPLSFVSVCPVGSSQQCHHSHVYPSATILDPWNLVKNSLQNRVSLDTAQPESYSLTQLWNHLDPGTAWPHNRYFKWNIVAIASKCSWWVSSKEEFIFHACGNRSCDKQDHITHSTALCEDFPTNELSEQHLLWQHDVSETEVGNSDFERSVTQSLGYGLGLREYMV